MATSRAKPPAPTKPKTPKAKPAAKRRPVKPSDEAIEAAARNRFLYQCKFDPEYIDQARKLCEMGATNHELAAFFDVAYRTIINWSAAYPEFAEALKSGKTVADDRVERSLFHRAVGYEHRAVKLFQWNGTIIEKEYTEFYPPDTVACIFWLKNRRKEVWRDKHEMDTNTKLSVSITPKQEKL